MKAKLKYVLAMVSLLASGAMTVKADASGVTVDFLKLPLRFEAAAGQPDESDEFVARGPGYTVQLRPAGVSLRLQGIPEPEGTGSPSARQSGLTQGAPCSGLRLSLVGANLSARLTGMEELPGKVNYFRGNDPAKWRRNVPTFGKVRCEQVYPGIDLVYYGTSQRQLEYDFILAPGADVTRIKLAVDGADQVRMDAEGDLLVHADGGQVRLHNPVIYQMVSGMRQRIAGRYVLQEAEAGIPSSESGIRNPTAVVTFQIAAYDTSLPLVIDPVLVYSTYLGGGRTNEGSNYDAARDIAVDAEGNVFVTGTTASPDFPVWEPLQATLGGSGALNAFVVKLGPGGSNLVYATYLGGAGQTQGSGIAVDSGGNAYVTGFDWGGPGFPLVNPLPVEPGGTSHAFVSKLNATGNTLVYSSLLGGSSTLSGGSANNHGEKIAVDSAGNAYVSGWTDATNFPTMNAVQPTYGGGAGDCFLAKLNAAGSALVYSTYLGGEAGELPTGTCVDTAGRVYVAGSTGSTNFPTTPTAFQPAFGSGDMHGFISKIDPPGSSLVYSTYLGGSLHDEILGLDVDTAGHAYVVGYARSSDFPTTAAAFAPAKMNNAFMSFVTKLSSDGSALDYSTYAPGEWFGDLAVDKAGSAHVIGLGRLSGDIRIAYFNQPVNAVQPTYGGGGADAWLLKMDPDGSDLLYATFLGGNDSDSPAAVAVDAAGNAYVVGQTSSTNFPTLNPFQSTNAGSLDVFVAKVAPDLDATPPRLVVAYTHLDPSVVTVVFTEPVTEASATNAVNYTIDSGVVVTGAGMGSNSKSVRLTTSPLPSGVDCVLTVNQVQDRALPTGNTIAANSQMLIIRTQGAITRKEFRSLPGNPLFASLGDSNFPDFPDVVDCSPVLEMPADAHARTGVGYQPPTSDQWLLSAFWMEVHDYYGVQFQGYVTPPVTGDYVFHLCSDAPGTLFLSPDENPANKTQIASDQGNAPRQWVNGLAQSTRGSPPRNISQPISLVAGRRYYLEALKSENYGGDVLGVTWRKPGDPEMVNGISPITGEYLSAFTSPGSVVITNQPVSQAVGESQPAFFTVGVDGTPPYDYQWFTNSMPFAGATNSVLCFGAASPSADGTTFSVVASNRFGVAVSSNAVLTVIADTNPPTLTSAQGNLNLDKLTLKFSEPVSSEEATNLASYALTGGLTLTGATLRSDRRTVVLNTSPQTEGMEYTLTVNGVHDLAAAANLIASNSPVSFTAWLPEEFVGPFSNWADVKRDFGAGGDGVADDTAALQQALDSIGWSGTGTPTYDRPRVLYVPAGTYRITQTLRFKYRIGVSLLGEDPASTILLWDGPAGESILHCNGVSWHKVSRFTLDGRGRALSGVDHQWDQTNQPHGTSGSEYSDLVIKDVVYGIRAGLGNNDAEVAVLRCHFLRCSEAGIRMQSYNAVDWFAWHCTFEGCRMGVTISASSGQCHVYNSLFRCSTFADISKYSCIGYMSFRNNFSINSKAFFAGETFMTGVGNVTIQGNTILDPQDTNAIRLGGSGPILVFDNTIRSRAEVQSGPVVDVWRDLVSVGNTYTVRSPLAARNRALSLDDRIVERDSLELEPPELPGPLLNRHRPVIEVRAGATAAEIQEAIRQADQLRGQRPVVHLPVGNYPIERTVVIPAGCDVQLVGDSSLYGTTLQWSGEGRGPVLRLAGPSRATLRDFGIWGANTANAIVVDNCDQPEARVFMEQVTVGLGPYGLIVDRLDQTDVSVHDSYHVGPQAVGVQVIGGPRRARSETAAGRVAIFGGASYSDSGLMYDVLNGGYLLVQDVWYEGNPARFMRLTDSGTFTLHGALITLYVPRVLPAIELDGFRGAATFLTCYAQNEGTFVITPESGDANLLLMGVCGYGDDYLVNDSSTAKAGRIASSRVGTAPTDLGSEDVLDQGDTSPAFVRKMLAQTRTEKPRLLWPRPAGVTDVRFFRVRAINGLVGIKLTGTNAPPTFTSVPTQTVNEGETLVLTNVVSDPDLPFTTLTFSLLSSAPVGAEINSTNGVLTWTPSEAQGPSSNFVGVVVTDDGSPPLSATNFVTVIVNEVNAAPMLDPIADQTVDEHATLTLTARATDADLPAQPLRFSLAPGAPAGASIDPISGQFRWTPGEAQGSSTNRIGIIVSDDGSPSLSATNSFTVVVREVNDPPIAQAASVVTDEDTPLLIVLTGTDPENDPLSFTVMTGPSHGILSGTPPILTYLPATNYHGTDQFTFKVSDGMLESAEARVLITVRSVNDLPTIMLIRPAANAQFIAPAKIEIEAEASDIDGVINKVEFFDATTHLGESAVAPFRLLWTNVVAGSHVLTAKATDNEGGETRSGELTIFVLASLRSAEVLADGSFCFRLAGEPGRYYVLEVSEDLRHWNPQQTNTVDVTGWMIVTEQVAAGPSGRYYRARLGP